MKICMKFFSILLAFLFGFADVAEAQYGVPPVKVFIKGEIVDFDIHSQLQVKVRNKNNPIKTIDSANVDSKGNFNIDFYDRFFYKDIIISVEDKNNKIYDTIISLDKNNKEFNENSNESQIQKSLKIKLPKNK